MYLTLLALSLPAERGAYPVRDSRENLYAIIPHIWQEMGDVGEGSMQGGL